MSASASTPARRTRRGARGLAVPTRTVVGRRDRDDYRDLLRPLPPDGPSSSLQLSWKCPHPSCVGWTRPSRSHDRASCDVCGTRDPRPIGTPGRPAYLTD